MKNSVILLGAASLLLAALPGSRSSIPRPALLPGTNGSIVNHGLVGVGRLDANVIDKWGE